MFKLRKTDPSDILSSKLYDQDTFYEAFIRDVQKCKSELIIESPFITTKRMNSLIPYIRQLRKRGVRIVVNTRHPEEHDGIYQYQAEEAILELQELDVLVLYTAGHHRKLAVIDKYTVWEGSLNILSQNDTCEIMRRITSEVLAQQMISFLKMEQYLL